MESWNAAKTQSESYWVDRSKEANLLSLLNTFVCLIAEWNSHEHTVLPCKLISQIVRLNVIENVSPII